MFINDESLTGQGRAAFERMLLRLLEREGYEGLRLVSRSADSADFIGHLNGRRWLFQCWDGDAPLRPSVVPEVLAALQAHRADVPVVVSLNGFDDTVYLRQRDLLSGRVPLQLWDRRRLLQRARELEDRSLAELLPARYHLRPFQDEASDAIARLCRDGRAHRALAIIAAGFGKTVIAAEALRRIAGGERLRVLALAHTNALVADMERAFRPYLRPSQETVVWTEYERPRDELLARASFVFARMGSAAHAVRHGTTLDHYDVVLVDECRHAGAATLQQVIEATRAGAVGGPLLLGLTAAPSCAGSANLEAVFGPPVVSLDLESGMQKGFLANVDYRMFTSEIEWDTALGVGERLSAELSGVDAVADVHDDRVLRELQSAWEELPRPRAVVFCGTIEQAVRMRDRINSTGFTEAATVFSAGSARGSTLPPFEQQRILADFDVGKIGVICAVDIFNEGIDVSDVNILSFHRVAHSRRILIRQLGRDLRLPPDGRRVIILDFVSDVRRIAATIA